MSTSKLQQSTARRLFLKYKKYGIVENTRPDWLRSSKGERLELDFYIEKLGVAVEVQGEQHVKFSPMFHKSDFDFNEQLRRDSDKKDVCRKRGIKLFYIYRKSEIDQVVYDLDSIVNNKLESAEFAFESPPSYAGFGAVEDLIEITTQRENKRSPSKQTEDICTHNVRTIARNSDQEATEKAKQRLLKKINDGKTTMEICVDVFRKTTTDIKKNESWFLEFMGWASAAICQTE